MTEDDCEIECLDEDADIVQLCVQTVDDAPTVTISPNVPLLVERKPVGRPRKKRKVEEDSDYEPSKYVPPRKRRTQKVLRSSKNQKYELYGPPPKLEVKEYGPRKYAKKSQLVKNEQIPRTQLDIRIPDYEDPLCMPVRAIVRDENDTKKLKIWNNLCLDNFKNSDTVLRTENGETVTSKRTVVLESVNNNITGRLETSMWSKITVENKMGDKKSEVVQCLLPKYREKKVLNSYSLVEIKRRRSFHHIDEVILTKEDQKDGETLVVYKPRETLSLVYKMFEKNVESSDGGMEDDEEQKRYLKEVASCRVCAPCYQVSWRGFQKDDKKIKCQICSRVCISVYNLLSHLKCHSAEDMHKYKRLVSKALAGVVEYHYKCRICQDQFPGIKELRRHILIHRGSETFICDIGSHLAT